MAATFGFGEAEIMHLDFDRLRWWGDIAREIYEKSELEDDSGGG